MAETNQSLCCKVRVTVYRPGFEDGHSFGKGIHLLLCGIRDTGSLNRTAKDMGMAYSRAWNILKQSEKELGFSLVERHGPKGSSLTEEGLRFLSLYEEMEAAAQKAVADVFCKYRK